MDNKSKGKNEKLKVVKKKLKALMDTDILKAKKLLEQYEQFFKDDGEILLLKELLASKGNIIKEKLKVLVDTDTLKAKQLLEQYDPLFKDDGEILFLKALLALKENDEEMADVFFQRSINSALKENNEEMANVFFQHYCKQTASQRKQRPISRLDKKVIVSLTSYPARLPTLHFVIKSVLNQTYKPDKVILYLDSDVDMESIGEELKELTKHGLSIEKRPGNLKPHKKYYYAMKEYPNDIIITIDDDMIYDQDLISSLIQSYQKYPYAVSARRVHRILKSNDRLLPYKQWELQCKSISEPSMQLLATGIGGVLYPPKCMNDELFNIEKINSLSLNADDIWLKFMQILNNTPVVWVKSHRKDIINIEGTQQTALMYTNLRHNENDTYINNLQEHYQIKLVADTIESK